MRILLASLVLAFFVGGTATISATGAPLSPTAPARAAVSPRTVHFHCRHRFTLRQVRRTLRAVYGGHRHVSTAQRLMIGRMHRCLRDRKLWRLVKRMIHHARDAWVTRTTPLAYAVASWYYDYGTTASGWHAYHGVAVCGSGGGPCVPFGTQILFVYHGRSVVATADDHGPYVTGRAFDLNQNTAAALGFAGVGTVGYHIK